MLENAVRDATSLSLTQKFGLDLGWQDDVLETYQIETKSNRLLGKNTLRAFSDLNGEQGWWIYST